MYLVIIESPADTMSRTKRTYTDVTELIRKVLQKGLKKSRYQVTKITVRQYFKPRKRRLNLHAPE